METGPWRNLAIGGPMSTYNSTKNPPYPELLQPGVPSYAFGSRNRSLPTVRMQITNIARTSNVVTLTVQMLEGNIPAVSDLITVTGTSAGSGGANTSNTPVALSAVTINATTGAGTVTYTKAGSDIVSVANAGQASVEVPEVAQVLTGATKSAAFAIQAAKGQGRGISWEYTCPSAPNAASLQLEGALVDEDALYAIIGSAITSTSGGQAFAPTPINVNFVRINVTSFTNGTNQSLIAKISQS